MGDLSQIKWVENNKNIKLKMVKTFKNNFQGKLKFEYQTEKLTAIF